MNKKFVFPDTSTFLYFEPLDEIDLAEMLQCEAVELVIAPVVTEELERRGWDDPLLGIRKRAEHSLRTIRSWLETRDGLVRPGVEVTLCHGPRQEIFVEYHLDSRRRDDLLIANVLEYSQIHGKEAVLLLTHDLHRKLKAHRFQLQVIGLPAEAMLPAAQEALRGEQVDVPREQARYPSRVPRVELRFENGSRILAVRPQKEVQPTPAMLATRLDELRAQCEEPLQFRESKAVAGIDDREAAALLVNAMLIPEEEYERYSRELDAFLEHYEEWLQSRAEAMDAIRRTVRLEFEVVNSGGADAEGIVITLSLPKKLQWRERLGSDDMPAAPEPPQPPRTYLEIARASISEQYSAAIPPWSAGLEPTEVPAADGWLIEGQELRVLLDTCRHHHSAKLRPVYAMFVDPEEISNFAITYVINQRTSPEPVDGKLLVRVA